MAYLRITCMDGLTEPAPGDGHAAAAAQAQSVAGHRVLQPAWAFGGPAALSAGPGPGLRDPDGGP